MRGGKIHPASRCLTLSFHFTLISSKMGASHERFLTVVPIIAASLNMTNRCCCVWYIYIFDCCFAILWARLVHLHGSSLMLRFHRMILSYQRQKSFLYHQNGRLSRGASRPFSAVSQPPSASPIAALLTITTYPNDPLCISVRLTWLELSMMQITNCSVLSMIGIVGLLPN